jgi:hypothetical protein
MKKLQYAALRFYSRSACRKMAHGRHGLDGQNTDLYFLM